jgi:hypothetical protein
MTSTKSQINSKHQFQMVKWFCLGFWISFIGACLGFACLPQAGNLEFEICNHKAQFLFPA